MNYSILYSRTTGKTTVHSETCAVVKGKFGTLVSAESAKAAAEQFAADEDFKARGLIQPSICKCAR
jgi:hypothetical protein